MKYVFRSKNGCCPECTAFGRLYYIQDRNLGGEKYELWAAQCKEKIDMITFSITNNIRDIIYENAIHEKFPPALKVDTSKGTYFFSIYE